MIQIPSFRHLEPSDEGFDLTALIDVIFTLIIFLILTMGTTQIMTDIDITRSRNTQLAALSKQASIQVEVSHPTRSWKTGGQTFGSFPQFRQQFLSLYPDQQKTPVILALEHTLPVADLIELMDFLSMNGFTRIQVVSQWKP